MVYHHLGLRYSRIFPDQFETLSLTARGGEPITASSYIALVDEGGREGRSFMEYMLSESVASIYRHHGMDHG